MVNGQQERSSIRGSIMPTFPTADESLGHLRRVAWSIGDVGTARA